MRSRGPGSVKTGGADAFQGFGGGEASRAAGAEDRFGSAGSPAGGAEGWDQAGGDRVDEVHGPVGWGRGASGARPMPNVCQIFLARAAVPPARIAAGGNS